MRNGNAAQSGVANTERSEQKVQGHVPGQGQGVKPIVSKFLVRLRSQEMGKALSEDEGEPPHPKDNPTGKKRNRRNEK